MTDDDDRIRRENEETERKGRAWADHSDAYLVGYVSEQNRPGQFHTPALVEIQRRLLVAIAAFNQQSATQTTELIRLSRAAGDQTDTMIRLTGWIIALTVVLGLIAALQLGVMFAEPLARLLGR